MPQTIRIAGNADFAAAEKLADALLTAKGLIRTRHKGSTSWLKPGNPEVRAKLCLFRDGLFFGLRDPAEVGLGWVPRTVAPSGIAFQGRYIDNTASGRGRITAIAALA
jgi:hypothetical protein